MRAHRLEFTGAILERGFWLYVWHVTCARKSFVYVGRTGDSSSRYAASPFNRLGQHLDLRESATANMLKRHIERAGLDPAASKFKLFAVGPIFPEPKGIRLHRMHRDIVAPLEAALARHMEGWATRWSADTRASTRLIAHCYRRSSAMLVRFFGSCPLANRCSARVGDKVTSHYRSAQGAQLNR
jgi:hypothetical protein